MTDRSTLDIEASLRRMLADERRALPGWADPLDRVTVGVVRRRRRRTTAVVAAALVAAVVIGVPAGLRLGVLAGPAPIGVEPDDGSVPWAEIRVPMPQWTIAHRPPRPDRRECRADEVAPRATSVDTTVPNGETNVRITLDRAGEDGCTLSGPAVLVATDAATGQRATLETNHGLDPNNGTQQYPATLDAGEQAHVTVATSACATTPPFRYRDIAVVVDGREVPVDGLELETRCPLTVGDWSVWPPVLTAPLAAWLEVPDTVRRGDVLAYTLVVRNDSAERFGLDDCPVYTQALGVYERLDWLRLNCAALAAVPPYTTVRFSMRLAVPSEQALGDAKLTWLGIFANGRVLDPNTVTGHSVRVVK